MLLQLEVKNNSTPMPQSEINKKISVPKAVHNEECSGGTHCSPSDPGARAGQQLTLEPALLEVGLPAAVGLVAGSHDVRAVALVAHLLVFRVDLVVGQ